MQRLEDALGKAYRRLAPMLAMIAAGALFWFACVLIGFVPASAVYVVGAGAAAIYVRMGTPRCGSVQRWTATYHDQIFGLTWTFPSSPDPFFRTHLEEANPVILRSRSEVLGLKQEVPQLSNNASPFDKDGTEVTAPLSAAIAQAAKLVELNRAIVITLRLYDRPVGLFVAIRDKQNWNITIHWTKLSLRGHGIGRRLLQLGLDEIELCDNTEVQAEVPRVYMSEHLYHAVGFRPKELRRHGWLYKRRANYHMHALAEQEARGNNKQDPDWSEFEDD